jgi:dCMP deaminase
MVKRPSWDEYFLAIAATVATRADCTRRQVGSLVVRDHRIVAAGYNGAAPGWPGCLSAGACPRGSHYVRRVVPEHLRDAMGIAPTVPVCACGNAWPCPEAVEHGSSYDAGPGACIALHAEQNAIMYAGRDGCLGSTLYITEPPCDGCDRMIRASGLIMVIAPRWIAHL